MNKVGLLVEVNTDLGDRKNYQAIALGEVRDRATEIGIQMIMIERFMHTVKRIRDTGMRVKRAKGMATKRWTTADEPTQG